MIWSQDKTIAELDCLLAEIPYSEGFPLYPAIKTSPTFKFKKNIYIYHVEAMRTIQLISAAFYMNNKQIGKKLMRQAEELHLIPEEYQKK